MNMRSHIIGNWAKRFFLAGFLLGSLVGLSSITIAQTGEPSREPILRIETGMHIAAINQISLDAANRYLVTASDDKTARVWELKTGRLVRILRPPSDTSNEGQLYAIAISPDGNRIAVGTATKGRENKTETIYIFDRLSGKLLNRLTDARANVNYLVYSPDSRYLAATLESGTLLIYDAGSNYRLSTRHSDCDKDSFTADFSPNGYLVTSCDDGVLRLYKRSINREYRLTYQHPTSGGARPYMAKFSPDGERIAVGYIDTINVNVLSGNNLERLYEPDTTGVINDLRLVTWSSDGQTLYAAGNYWKRINNRAELIVRLWTKGGNGTYRDLDRPNAGTTINLIGLKAPKSGVVYSNSGEIASLDDLRTVHFITKLSTNAYSPFQQDFLLSPNGETTAFKFGNETYAEKSLIHFCVAKRTISIGNGTNANDLTPPRWKGQNLNVSRLGTTELIFNEGVTLKLEDTIQNITFTLDGSGVFVSTNGYVRLFDRNGKLRWKVLAPAYPNNCNPSTDGRFAVVAFADGTIRWYRMTDGKELLAFFPHADRKRWVLWTPSGYYDASPGAEELIGWHVNNGKDQAADFFPVGQFRSTYYRPDVISKVLETGDEGRALQVANEERGRKTQLTTVVQMLPPVVEIASPADNSEVSASEVTIRYSLRTPSGEAVTNVRALVDGRPVTGNRQLTREDASASGAHELKISVPERDSEVSIIAENKFAASVPATIRLRWRGSAPTTEAFIIQPKLYVLAIGVSQYQNPSYSLKFAAKDAQDFAAATTIQKGLLYRDVVVKVLTNEHATKDEILDGLDWIRKETTSKDVAMVFFAGHGLNDQNGIYYFLPYNTDLEKLLRTGVPFTDIKNTVQSLAGKTLFFIDTCHSGNVLGGRRGLADDLNGIINELSSAESGAVVFAASTGNQYSLEDVKWNNGAFTKALVEGITGRADYTGKGRITINMLDLYISERVKELTGGKQTPTTAKPNTVPDFPIAVKR
jgi:WD40 repeat protein